MEVSNKNKEEVTKFVEYMKVIYGKNMPVVRGDNHTYVGMDLGYSSSGEAIVSMHSYITEEIENSQKK